jgi:hypothetical protein
VEYCPTADMLADFFTKPLRFFVSQIQEFHFKS